MKGARTLVTDRAFQAGFCLALIFWLVCAEVFCRYAAGSGWWYRHFDFAGRLVSRAELEDRLAYLTRRPGSVCLLGDSVAGASALIESRLPDAEQNSLARRLQAHLEGTGRHAFSLSADGLLLPDIEAIAAMFERSRPAAAVILLNYRMFAPEFQTDAGASSRAFLAQREDMLPSLLADDSTALSVKLENLAQRHSALFRSTQLLKSLWYFPSQKAFLQRELERWIQRPEEDDLAKAALKLKVAPYYQPLVWQTDSLAFRSLGRLLDGLRTMQISTRVVLTPQNSAYLAGMLNPSTFKQNRALLAEFVRARAGAGIVYADWADRYPTRNFLDHCHLTQTGNDQYATDLAQLALEGP